MTQPLRFEPDLEFIREVMAAGGDTVKKCYQCATCSVVCTLSPDDRPFPRKEMILAQWGLKDKLARDPDLWLCHNCNDCSTYCPRGARPGDVLNTLRQKVIETYAFPRALARRVGDPRSLGMLLGLPALAFLLLIAFTNLWWWGEVAPVERGGKLVHAVQVHGSQIVLEEGIRSWEMLPLHVVDTVFILTALWALAVLAAGVFRFWRALEAEHPRQMGVVPAAFEVFREIFKHRNFKECGTNRERYLGHLGIFYGFAALFATTTCVFLGIYVLNLVVRIPLTPWPLWNPIKLLGNLGGVALLAGGLLAVRERLRADREKTASSYFDWLLLGLVLAVAATGLLAEEARWAGIGFVYYLLYYAHLVFVWSLFAYSPYSKLAHVVYRTAALIHAKAEGRYLMQQAPVVALSEGGSVTGPGA
jgi:quinone-modifying oxidoreductase, subunit QmoC